jgi:hypothetical protein
METKKDVNSNGLPGGKALLWRNDLNAMKEITLKN